MGECEKLRDRIALYASGDLEEKHRARVAAHLQRCPECRRAAAEMRTLVGVACAERVAPPAELAARIAQRAAQAATAAPARPALRWSVAFGYAGAVMLVFGAGMFVGFQLPRLMLPREGAAVLPSPSVGALGSRRNVAAQPPPGPTGRRAGEEAAVVGRGCPSPPNPAAGVGTPALHAASLDSEESRPGAHRPRRRPTRYAYHPPEENPQPVESPSSSQLVGSPPLDSARDGPPAPWGGPELVEGPPAETPEPAPVQAPMPAGADDVRLAGEPEPAGEQP